MNSATRELSEWFLNDELSVSNVSQVSGSLVSSKLFSVCRMILLCQRMIRLASLQLYRPSDPVSRPNNFVLLRYSIIKYSPPKIVFNLKYFPGSALCPATPSGTASWRPSTSATTSSRWCPTLPWRTSPSHWDTWTCPTTRSNTSTPPCSPTLSSSSPSP